MHYRNLTLKLGVIIICIILFSCSEERKYEQSASYEISNKNLLSDLNQQILSNPRDSKFEEVKEIDGKRVIDFYKKWLENDKNRSNICGEPPEGCVVNSVVDEIINVGSCEFTCSYDIYDCGFGNVGIYNFTFEPSGGNCFAYNFSVTENYNDGDLAQYIEANNFFASIILSQIEDSLLPTINTPNNTVVFFTYFPNICFAQCSLGGVQDLCGEDCCIRFSVSQLGERSVDVFSFGQCIGTEFECSNSTVPCNSLDCKYLEIYR